MLDRPWRRSTARCSARARRSRSGCPSAPSRRTLRSLGDDGLRELVDRYVDAWERCDVDAFTAHARRGRDVRDAAAGDAGTRRVRRSRRGPASRPLSGAWRWRAVLTQANAQPALGFYAWDEAGAAYLPFALNVLSLRDGLVSDVTAFIARSTEPPSPRPTHASRSSRWTSASSTGTFERFGLPDRLN